MITVICGHRGTGKSSLARRIKIYSNEIEIIDLDELIEKSEKKSITDIFKKDGEPHFRQLEKKYWTEVLKKSEKPTYIITGAGFDVGLVPPTVDVLWVRRDSDEIGRVFLNRPPLNSDVSPLEDYLSVFARREERFRARANSTYSLPEGLSKPHPIEKEILFKTGEPQGFYTLLKGNLTLDYPRTTYELRTDLLSLKEIEAYLSLHHNRSFLLSFRSGSKEEFFKFVNKFKNISYVDWPLESGNPPDEFLNLSIKKIISLHSEDPRQLSLLESFEKVASLKWSPRCNDFDHLAQAITWQRKNESSRSVLPRSENGRWSWARILLNQKINFWRDGAGSAADQPTLFEWLQKKHFDRHPRTKERFNFGAVLGSPVKQSWSPIFHEEFFRKRLLRFFAIHIEKSEWVQAINLLVALGLKAAAVTSPLKIDAAEWLKLSNPVNTLVFDTHHNRWEGFNTDVEGVNGWPTWARRKRSALWGGEGVKPLVETTKDIQHFSSRTGMEKPRSDDSQDLALVESLAPNGDLAPEILIWAAPRNDETKMPPADWPIKLVIDVNYGENSLGKELAINKKIAYISGAEFFRQQALAQQRIWNKFL